ncbi:olfactory receptor 5D18-like [Arvicola amphibius]|uniref:olfactory receptor 5D18-like n=1 Tax=Arvicola amphibius TaxID=1047088 RepID=UPI0018E2F8BA|nr:olfactory receptor 5D18-like [Arvicola amphibius]
MLLTYGNNSGAIFILLGFSDYPELKLLLFLIFLTIYSTTVVGNIGMILIIRINPKLHTPMYFFLSHLSFVDFCYSSVIAPKILVNLVAKDRIISFLECIVQYFFFATFVVTESVLLVVMAYDRFVAICSPLLYTVTMTQRLCLSLVVASYAWGLTCALTMTCSAVQLSFVGVNTIDHLFCEFSSLIALSCSDIHVNQILLLSLSTVNAVSNFLLLLLSYVFILVTILKMHASRGRRRAFSTCASHLMTITIFYGTILFLYSVPKSENSKLTFKVASLFYTLVIPMLNPLIYSLRNKDVKDTIRKIMMVKLIIFLNSSSREL